MLVRIIFVAPKETLFIAGLNSSNQKIDRSNNFIPERTQIMRWLDQDLGWHTRCLLCQDHEVPFIQMDDRA
jgi:hypothetical protein